MVDERCVDCVVHGLECSGLRLNQKRDVGFKSGVYAFLKILDLKRAILKTLASGFLQVLRCSLIQSVYEIFKPTTHHALSTT